MMKIHNIYLHANDLRMTASQILDNACLDLDDPSFLGVFSISIFFPLEMKIKLFGAIAAFNAEMAREAVEPEPEHG